MKKMNNCKYKISEKQKAVFNSLNMYIVGPLANMDVTQLLYYSLKYS